MKAIEVTNNTNTSLEGGNCVVLEDDKYIGESFIVNVKPEEPQLVSYAVEKNVLVKTETKTDHQIPHAMRFKNESKKMFVDKFSQADYLLLLNKIVNLAYNIF